MKGVESSGKRVARSEYVVEGVVARLWAVLVGRASSDASSPSRCFSGRSASSVPGLARRRRGPRSCAPGRSPVTRGTRGRARGRRPGWTAPEPERTAPMGRHVEWTAVEVTSGALPEKGSEGPDPASFSLLVGRGACHRPQSSKDFTVVPVETPAGRFRPAIGVRAVCGSRVRSTGPQVRRGAKAAPSRRLSPATQRGAGCVPASRLHESAPAGLRASRWRRSGSA